MALRQEYKFHPISSWISRHPELQRGFSCMDVDLLWENHIHGYCMHFEFKHKDEAISDAQRANIRMIADVWSRSNPVRHFDQYSTPMKYLGYYVIILDSEEITNEHGIYVVRVAAHEDEVEEWQYDDGAADVLLQLCNGKLL
jgi:hypothetical protein